MPTVPENIKLWSEHGWSAEGEEWTVGYADGDTGTAEIAWSACIWPRIHRYLPAHHVLEIGPGFGVWTRFLRPLSRRMTLVDVTPRCIEQCRKRFGERDICYAVNDGRSLDCVADGSVDFVFSWHSLVHCQHDVMRAYVEQLGRKLCPGAAGMIQHSNLGAFADVPGRLPDPCGYGEDMTAQLFADDATRSGLEVITQELVPWSSAALISCFSLFRRPLCPPPPRQVAN